MLCTGATETASDEAVPKDGETLAKLMSLRCELMSLRCEKTKPRVIGLC